MEGLYGPPTGYRTDSSSSDDQDDGKDKDYDDKQNVGGRIADLVGPSGAVEDDSSAEANHIFGEDEIFFHIPMINRCNVSRRLHLEYQASTKSASIVALNYWHPVGKHRQYELLGVRAYP